MNLSLKYHIVVKKYPKESNTCLSCSCLINCSFSAQESKQLIPKYLGKYLHDELTSAVSWDQEEPLSIIPTTALMQLLLNLHAKPSHNLGNDDTRGKPPLHNKACI